MAAVKELSEIVDDKEAFLNDLSDAMSNVNATGELFYLERFIDTWETRTVSSNEMSLGNVFVDNISDDCP
jgi:hypothetical protein